MATSKRATVLFVGLALSAALVIAGCGGAGSSSAGSSSSGGATAARSAGPFGWLSPSRPPAGWIAARLPSGDASFAYPPGWRRITSDSGTVSAALMGAHGRIRGYLNATPRQANEKLANWARFRIAHNRGEGDMGDVRDAAARGLHFRTGVGSCVMDHYATVSAHYREIACLVRGTRASTVLVGAALPRDWKSLGPALERSISSFTT
jgi:hypothetical protein